jgi:transposase
MMTKEYTEAYKRKVVQRLVGPWAVSAHELARETGVSQSTLSRWLREGHTLPPVADPTKPSSWSLDDKIRILAESRQVTGAELVALLEREGVSMSQLEQWRRALDEEGRSSTATTKRLRTLERELARKEKALAEAAALLILKKKVEEFFPANEDDDSSGENEK